jgi:hypothetical protein
MSGLTGKQNVGQCAVAFLQRALDLVRSMLREIFDESAYERFLERRGVASSHAAYADFLREGHAAHERRPRCC